MSTRRDQRRPPRSWLGLSLILALGLFVAGAAIVAQERGTARGEWRYIGGDVHHTRHSPLDQIDAGNFEDLEVAWVWRGDNFGPTVDTIFRSTPIYVDEAAAKATVCPKMPGIRYCR